MIQTTKGGLASVITAIEKVASNLDAAKKGANGKRFYRVYDTQTGCYFATGYNATSMKDVAKSFASYILMTNEVEDNQENRGGFLSSWDGIAEYLQGVILESSKNKFEELDNF